MKPTPLKNMAPRTEATIYSPRFLTLSFLWLCWQFHQYTNMTVSVRAKLEILIEKQRGVLFFCTSINCFLGCCKIPNFNRSCHRAFLWVCIIVCMCVWETTKKHVYTVILAACGVQFTAQQVSYRWKTSVSFQEMLSRYNWSFFGF